jgi:hypothetical protein
LSVLRTYNGNSGSVVMQINVLNDREIVYHDLIVVPPRSSVAFRHVRRCEYSQSELMIVSKLKSFPLKSHRGCL